jgi:hypothetical protein
VLTLSVIPIERQLGADGATWLDRELVADAPVPLRDSGFGREVRDALARRRQWLIEQELARAEQDQTIYRANMLGILRRRELTRVAGQLSDELGSDYADVRPGERIEGLYRRSIEMASGRFAVIEKSGEFTLVPWRPVLERSLGRPVSGIAGKIRARGRWGGSGAGRRYRIYGAANRCARPCRESAPVNGRSRPVADSRCAYRRVRDVTYRDTCAVGASFWLRAGIADKPVPSVGGSRPFHGAKNLLRRRHRQSP